MSCLCLCLLHLTNEKSLNNYVLSCLYVCLLYLTNDKYLSNNYVLSFAFAFDRDEEKYQFALAYPYSYSRSTIPTHIQGQQKVKFHLRIFLC